MTIPTDTSGDSNRTDTPDTDSDSSAISGDTTGDPSPSSQADRATRSSAGLRIESTTPVAEATPIANGDPFVVCLLKYDDPGQAVPSKMHATTLGTGFESLGAIAHEIRRRLDGGHCPRLIRSISTGR